MYVSVLIARDEPCVLQLLGGTLRPPTPNVRWNPSSSGSSNYVGCLNAWGGIVWEVSASVQQNPSSARR